MKEYLNIRVIPFFEKYRINEIDELIVEKFIEKLKLEEHLSNWQVVSAMLILVGIAFLAVETLGRNREPRTSDVFDISLKEAVLIGLFQLIAAVFPGTSRSGATIIGGLIIGVSRAAAADFTFILAIPVMAGSSLLKLLKYDGSFTGTELMVLATGMISALVVSLLVIRLLLGFIKNHDFKPFGIYRIILGILVIAYFAFLR